ncbi:kazrin isoform X1 [Dendrobates tinctorius]|uniref:kazrin isoform X1 n=2 Tax=Dendrobates tinctorius TaxID=92724 RepID=UPI003CC9D0D7
MTLRAMDATGPVTFSHVFGQQCEVMEAAVKSLHTLNDQISHFIVAKPSALEDNEDIFHPTEKESLKKSMIIMRQLLVEAQANILQMMEENKQLALRIDGAVQCASQEVTNLRAELTATHRRLAELSGADPCVMENNQHNSQGLEYSNMKLSRSGTLQMQDKYTNGLLLREEVSQLQDEVHLLRQMKEMLAKDLEESHDSRSAEILSVTELKVQLAQKEQELARAKEALQAMKADRRRLKSEKADLVSQMEQLYSTLESREEQLRDFIRNYEQHRKESEDAVKVLAKEKDLLEREKWELRRQAKEATDHASSLRSQLDLKDNRIKELEAELSMITKCVAQRKEYRVFDHYIEKEPSTRGIAGTVSGSTAEDRRRGKSGEMSSGREISPWRLYYTDAKGMTISIREDVTYKAKQSLSTLTKDVPKRHSLAMPGETVLNGNQEWVMHADLPLTAAIRQSQQTLYHGHPQHTADRQAVRVSPCHSRQPSVISDASAAEGDRSSTPSDINSPRHRTHSLCNSLEDLEDQKRKKKKEKMGFGSISRVFARGKQRKSLDPGLFDGTTPDYYIEEDADW